jgi:hypothetical protein
LFPLNSSSLLAEIVSSPKVSAAFTKLQLTIPPSGSYKDMARHALYKVFKGISANEDLVGAGFGRQLALLCMVFGIIDCVSDCDCAVVLNCFPTYHSYSDLDSDWWMTM